jgi:hypothetical protein
MSGLIPLKDQGFNDNSWDGRKAVCRKCHQVMRDAEPMSRHGEFWHREKDKHGKPYRCTHGAKRFSFNDKEIEPFMKKSTRRGLKKTAKRKPR